MAILLVVIHGYFIGGYWRLLMAIIVMAIGYYIINDYWWLFINDY